LQLTKQNSLIVPVHLEGVEAELNLGGVRFVAKKEHHLTVFGFGTGKVLGKVLQAQAGLREKINERAAAFDWGIEVVPRLYRLVRPQGAGGTLETVIVGAKARVHVFYEEVRAMLSEPLGELGRILALPPPPHVTLCTTDPEGLAGIGLNTLAEFDDAIARGVAGDTTKLTAYLLAPGVVSVPRLAT
jgi:hypothetical protein